VPGSSPRTNNVMMMMTVKMICHVHAALRCSSAKRSRAGLFRPIIWPFKIAPIVVNRIRYTCSR